MPQQEVVINKLRTAVPYLHDANVKEKFENLLDKLEEDINDVGLETSSETDVAIADLDLAINEFDENTSRRGAELREAVSQARENADGTEEN